MSIRQANIIDSIVEVQKVYKTLDNTHRAPFPEDFEDRLKNLEDGIMKPSFNAVDEPKNCINLQNLCLAEPTAEHK